ncbi:recombination regulator RecX [Clostridium saccharoperbutylacetonicum]|jgi:regulatory protein|uniref:Regulatory protein RecX n=1 Tax=Clostridium saccharoperbutylacetonicum N1-4(HMT) TaxID=931276 RepID=M1N399_9CLOT|nr:recombination regulator RecX [Clostridium saccharoperbutylacetonicum]AGF57932.1 regulatory protein RecX [Clostridium saccharoperbutylacetonicum N1-4(HMT)]AQR96607.1 regulatory protein RecX [Clostridium saccharoperbutylacetonicum]NRT61295.1 regulatory protein [Clostridium saccharoperbutylacetonicum]NSB24612.1 regulatory protein [Clostridium saccharoperbutylacetonicum]NSB32483.1 regulatory protein [Clostridium saccharoperbutylacetonicum]
MAIITKIEVQKRNKERVNLFLDGEYALSISAELVYKEHLKVKDNIDYDKLKLLAEKEGFAKCKESALRIVERNYKTEKQVREKLKLKGYEENAIDYSIEFLKEYNFINDNYYASAFINDKSNSMGSQKIKYNLIQKGVSKEIIEEALANVNKENERDIALEIAKKKLVVIKKKENDNYKISGKLYRYLISKGYEMDIVSDVVKEVIRLEE